MKSRNFAEKRTNFIKKRWKALLLIAVALVSLVGFARRSEREVEAVFDETTCLTFSNYAAGHTIPDGTIFIGTYLVDIDAMNDTIYDMAEETATSSGQTDIYYKSELGSGFWYDITSASGVSSIQEEGDLVDSADLADLYVKYYISDTGAITDVKTGDGDANLFVSDDFYNMWKMDAFSALTQLYSTYGDYQTDTHEIDYAQWLINEYLNLYTSQSFSCMDMWKHNFSWAVTTAKTTYDTKLTELQQAYQKVMQSTDPDQKELATDIYELMEVVYAEKQIYYYGVIQEQTNSDTIMSYFTNPGSHCWWDHDDQGDKCYLTPDTLILENLEAGIESLNDSMQDAEKKLVTEPGDDATELEKDRYTCFAYLMNNIDRIADMPADMKEYLTRYNDINHILDNIVADKDRELTELNRVLPEISDKLTEGVSSGVGSKYTEYKNEGASDEVLQNELDAEAAELEAIRDEIQFAISAKVLRGTKAEKVEYLSARLEWTEALKDKVVDDEFSSSANLTIQNHIDWLSGELGDALSDSSELAEELESLESEKDSLQLEEAQAYDNNDLETAAEIADEISDIDDQISDLLEEIAALAAEGDVVAETILNSSDSVDGLISQLEENVAEDLSNGKSSSSSLTALKMIGADESISELTELYGNDSNFQSALDEANSYYNSTATRTDKNNRLASNSSSNGSSSSGSGSGDSSSGSGSSDGTDDGNGSGNGSSGGGSGNDSDSSSSDNGSDTSGSGDGSSGANGSGDDSGNGSGDSDSDSVTASAVKSAIESAFGDSFDNLSDADQASVILGLNDLGNDGSGTAAELAETYADLAGITKNGCIYTTANNPDGTRFTSLVAAAKVTRYRYVFNDIKSTATMVNGGNVTVCRYQLGSKTVIDANGSKKAIDCAPKQVSGWVYADADSVEKYLEVSSEDISGTGISIAYTEKMSTKAKKFSQTVTEAAE